MAFVQNQAPTFPKQPQTSRVNIVNSDGQNQKTGYTAGSSGSRIFGVIAASTDGTARDVQMSITHGGTSYPIAVTTVAITAGTVAGTPAQNMMSTTQIPGMPKDNASNPFLNLVTGDTLTFSALTSVTTAKTITIHVIGADF